jgi:hypothetical protein
VSVEIALIWHYSLEHFFFLNCFLPPKFHVYFIALIGFLYYFFFWYLRMFCSDEGVGFAMQEGCKLSRAEIVIFKHNDMVSRLVCLLVCFSSSASFNVFLVVFFACCECELFDLLFGGKS